MAQRDRSVQYTRLDDLTLHQRTHLRMIARQLPGTRIWDVETQTWRGLTVDEHAR